MTDGKTRTTSLADAELGDVVTFEDFGENPE
jgi:hypothetical protein